MLDLKVINSVLTQLEEERGIPREKIMEAIELALATAYKKEYGKRGQIIRSKFNHETGETDFEQVKIVADENSVRFREEGEEAEVEEKQSKKKFVKKVEGEDEEEEMVEIDDTMVQQELVRNLDEDELVDEVEDEHDELFSL